MIKKSTFHPPFILSNAHIQTSLPTLLPIQRYTHPVRRERLIMPDTDFVEFDWFSNRRKGPIVILLHGITGSIKAHYIQNMIHLINQKEWRPILMYYRGCSGTPNLIEKSYHAGDTLGLDTLIRELKAREPDTPIFAVGYSMGANVLLKWLGETQTDKSLVSAVAISTPFDLRLVANRLRHGISQFYQWWLIGDLHDYVLNKFRQRPAPFDFGDLTHLRSIWTFDDAITAPLNGFKDASELYEKTSCIHFLKNINIPVLAIHALDDPFMIPDILPKEKDLSSDFTIEISEKGGHVGFIEGSLIPLHIEFWADKRATEHIEDCLLKKIQVNPLEKPWPASPPLLPEII